MNEEKSFYDKLKERNMEDAKALPPTPKEVGQHILYLKMAVIDRVETIENLTSEKLCTFRKGKFDDENSKFGFTEEYVNLLMHYAYEAGRKSTEDDYKRATESMNKALEAITAIVDEAGYIEYPEY